jgi:hypothetical protein
MFVESEYTQTLSSVGTALINPIKQIFFLIINLKMLQKLNKFGLKCFLNVMPFLVFDVADNCIQLRTRIGKRPETFLPTEFAFDKSFLINKSARICFYVLHQFGNLANWFQTDKNVNMIFDSADCQKFLPVICDNTRRVFVKFFSPFGFD